MDNYNFYTTGEENLTLPEDSPEDSQKLTIFMLSRQEIVPDLPITSSSWVPALALIDSLAGSVKIPKRYRGLSLKEIVRKAKRERFKKR